MAIVPHSFEEWKYCIEIKCGIALTDAYVESRISALQDFNSKEVKDFVRLYGAAHLEKILSFFRRSQSELKSQ